MSEEWRPVVGYEGHYEVSSLGRVRGLPRVITRKNGVPQALRGGIIRQHPLSSGYYPKVDLRVNGKSRSVPVHRLVGTAFLGPLPDGLETRHLNGDGFDNRVENLRYGTHTENMQDSIAHGTHVSLIYRARVRCGSGHEYTSENTAWRKGVRHCRRCDVAKCVRYAKRQQARFEASGGVTPHLIREWAKSQGIEVAAGGRLSNELKDAYAAAHPEKGWEPTPDSRKLARLERSAA